MKDIFYLNGVEVIEFFKQGKYKYAKLITGEILKTPIDTKFQLKCKICNKLSKPVKINHNQIKNYINLKKSYYCFKCRSLYFNGFKGHKHTEEYKIKARKRAKDRYTGEKNPMYGKHIKDYMTEEKYLLWKKHISDATKGEKNPMYGKDWRKNKTEEELLLHSKRIKETQASFSAEKRKEISKKLSLAQQRCKEKDPVYYKEIKARGGRATTHKKERYKKTKLEEKVENWLIKNNINYEHCIIMGSKENCYQYDFIIHNKRILIEANGDYWHGNPNIYSLTGEDGKKKLNQIQLDKIKKDKLKLKFAQEHNFKLLYIWESDVNNMDFSALEGVLND